MSSVNTANAATVIQSNPAIASGFVDIFSEFATDVGLENNGAWFTYKGTTRFLIARSNNRAYGKDISEALEKHAEALKGDDEASNQLNQDLMAEVMARTILKGWENVAFQGKPVEYSFENAKKLLMLSDFRTWVKSKADDREGYRIKELEAKAKN